MADPAKLAFAFTSKLFTLLLPIIALPRALNALPAAMVTVVLATTGAEKVEDACTVSAWLLLVPMDTLPLAVSVPTTVTALLAVTKALKLAAALAAKTPFVVIVAEGAKVVGELMLTVLLLSVPSNTLPSAAKALPVLTVTGALAMTAARNVVAAATVKVLELSVPRMAFPRALRMFPAVMVTGAAAVTAAAKLVAALTVSVCELVVPMAVLPLVLSLFSSVLPDTVRVAVGLSMLVLPKKVARPLLSMVRRSTSWLVPVLVLPVELVLKMRLPPSWPAASCTQALLDSAMESSCQLQNPCIQRGHIW